MKTARLNISGITGYDLELQRGQGPAAVKKLLSKPWITVKNGVGEEIQLRSSCVTSFKVTA